MSTVTVKIENLYACGRQSTAEVEVPAPPSDTDLLDWFADEVHDLTGDGHPCGAYEHAIYDVRIVATSDPERADALIGESFSWEG